MQSNDQLEPKPSVLQKGQAPNHAPANQWTSKRAQNIQWIREYLRDRLNRHKSLSGEVMTALKYLLMVEKCYVQPMYFTRKVKDQVREMERELTLTKSPLIKLPRWVDDAEPDDGQDE